MHAFEFTIADPETTPEPAPNPRTGDSTGYVYFVAAIALFIIAGGVLTRKIAVKK